MAIEILPFRCTDDDTFILSESRIIDLNAGCLNKRMVQLQNHQEYNYEPIAQADFIFTQAIQTDRGYMVEFLYNSNCAESCRKFVYILKIWRNGHTIHEYRSPVGQGIFTGCCHQGFRVTIVPPPPETLSNCKCAIFFIGTEYHIPMSTVCTHSAKIYHLYESRYVMSH